ncbi:MAG: hypothetical protein ABW321_29795 [Polyangiales bacterium]
MTLRSWELACAVALLLTGSACATAPELRDPQPPAADEVLAELARRSTLPESELHAMLADCGADDQHLYVCAFQAFVAKDIVWKRLVAERIWAMPACSVLIESRVARLERMRGEACHRTAEDAQVEGTIAAAMEASCAADTTNTMIGELSRITHCVARANR